MQLVAYGAQDIYLTGQPQITFFKSVYRRHTNFATESIMQTINGTSGPGSRVTVTVSRNGDLLENLWIQYNPSKIFTTVSTGTVLPADFGHAMLDYLELEIGGQLVDRQYGRWLTIWRDLTEQNPSGTQGVLATTGAEPTINTTSVLNAKLSDLPTTATVVSVGTVTTTELSTRYQRMSYTHQGATVGTSVATMVDAPSEAYIPMRFWFCRNPGLAIPLIALQYHEVKFNINFTALSVLCGGTTPVADYGSIAVYADYIYLDTTERRQFAQNAHEYLIDQLQVQQQTAGSVLNPSVRLNFNHPVKEIIFTGAPVKTSTSITGIATPMPIVANGASTSNTKVKLTLNGTDRMTERNIKYFTRNQIWDCHTGFGATGSADAIAVYSFALRPEEHQPSGTCNFSRIDTAQLVFSGSETLATNIDIYAVNYNVLRIMSGMGGLAYSN